MACLARFSSKSQGRSATRHTHTNTLFFCRDKAWSVNRLGRIARLHHQPEACVQIINTLYGFNAMEVQEAFVKASCRACCHTCCCTAAAAKPSAGCPVPAPWRVQ